MGFLSADAVLGGWGGWGAWNGVVFMSCFTVQPVLRAVLGAGGGLPVRQLLLPVRVVRRPLSEGPAPPLPPAPETLPLLRGLPPHALLPGRQQMLERAPRQLMLGWVFGVGGCVFSVDAVAYFGGKWNT